METLVYILEYCHCLPSSEAHMNNLFECFFCHIVLDYHHKNALDNMTHVTYVLWNVEYYDTTSCIVWVNSNLK